MISREPSTKVEYWTVAKQLGWDHASSQYLGYSRSVSLTPFILPLFPPSLPPSIHYSPNPSSSTFSYPPSPTPFLPCPESFFHLSINLPIHPYHLFSSFDSFIHAITSEIILSLLFICFSTTGTVHSTCYIAPWAVRTIIHSSS